MPYVANSADDSVSSYVVDADTGRLHYISKTATGTAPRAIASQYAYVANQGETTVS